MRREMLECVVLLPLMSVDLRAAPSRPLTVSDASESGAGVFASRSMTTKGKLQLRKLLGMPKGQGRDAIALIVLGETVGGARRAFDILGVELAFLFLRWDLC